METQSFRENDELISFSECQFSFGAIGDAMEDNKHRNGGLSPPFSDLVQVHHIFGFITVHEIIKANKAISNSLSFGMV